LCPIPRPVAPRPQKNVDSGPPPLADATIELKAALGYTVIRSAKYTVEGLRLCSMLAWDRLRGHGSARDVGRRLRMSFQRIGGVAVRVGRLAATRVDLLHQDVCNELAQMTDVAPPFALADALKCIERAAGCPVDDAYDEFEPTPLASGTISNVYSARLKSGQRVAIKVRRPGIVQRFATDLRIVLSLTRVPEILAIVPDGFFSNLRESLLEPIAAELDFAREARFQRLFRRYARKDRLRWLTAPKVYTRLCGADVIVSEWIDGIPCDRLRAAVKAGDQASLMSFAALDITPKLVAHRVMTAQFWGSFEALFVHADPHSSNILVMPGSRLVFIDFSVVQDATASRRDGLAELLKRVLEDDVTGAAEVAIAMLSPLPNRVDVYHLKKRLESEYYRFVFALHDPLASPQERAFMQLWLRLLRTSRTFRIPVERDLLQLAHAAALYDTLTCDLCGQMKMKQHYKRYGRQMLARAARRVDRTLERLATRSARDHMAERIACSARDIRRGMWTVQTAVKDIPVQLDAAIGRGAYFALLALRSIIQVLIIAVVAWAIRTWLPKDGGPLVLAAEGFAYTVIAIVLFGILAIFVRRVLIRLNQFDGRSSDSS
jgi:ubiquinone biosynthesis protein